MATIVQRKAAWVFFLALFPVFLLPPGDGSVQAQQEKNYPPELSRSMEALSQSIQAGNSSGIRAILAKGKKIVVQFPLLSAIPEYYGAAQAEVMFQSFFKIYRTMGFAYVSRNAVVTWSGVCRVLASDSP